MQAVGKSSEKRRLAAEEAAAAGTKTEESVVTYPVVVVFDNTEARMYLSANDAKTMTVGDVISNWIKRYELQVFPSELEAGYYTHSYNRELDRFEGGGWLRFSMDTPVLEVIRSARATMFVKKVPSHDAQVASSSGPVEPAQKKKRRATVCAKCWLTGHNSRGCPAVEWKNCNTCGNPGHIPSRCKPHAKCSECGVLGHYRQPNNCKAYQNAMAARSLRR